MRNLFSAEKMLKHWFKKKMTITTATVIGFLLTGAMAFSADANDKIINANEVLDSGLIFNSENQVVYVENNGKIEITDNSKLVKHNSAIYFQQENKDGKMKELVNNGEIIVKNSDANFVNGIKLLGNARVTNNNLINVENKGGDAYGIFALATKEYTSDKPFIENNGTISVTAKRESSALRVGNSSDKEINVINTGVLKAGRFDNTSDKLDNIYVVNLTSGKIKFENSGTVAIVGDAKGYAIGGVLDTNIINKGIIAIPLNSETVAIQNKNGVVENLGAIQITNKTVEELKQEGFDPSELIVGSSVNDKGLIADKNGIALDSDVDFIGDITAETINKNAPSVTIGDNTTIVGGTTTANIENIKVIGKVDVKNNDKTESVKLGTKALVLDGNGKLNVVKDSKLEISNSTVSKLQNGVTKDKEAIILGENSELALNKVIFNGGDITGATSSKITTSGDSSFNGTIKDVGTITVGEKSNLSLSTDSKYESTNGTKGNVVINGNVNLAVGAEKNKDGEYTQNFFNNSNGFINATGKGTITVDTQNIDGKKAVINLGDKNSFADTLTGKLAGNEVYEAGKIENGKLTLSYKDNIYENSGLDAVHNQAYLVNSIFGSGETRKEQLDKIYSSNIYSETVKASYNNVKLNEETILSLARTSEVGKWTAEGKAIYDKSEYDRDGITKDYSSEVESTGLMGALSYGLDETITAGVAFSGVKQDVDTDGGSADADLFYLGVYGNKVYGNYDFTAGLGYQFGKYEADNTIANLSTSDKYDSKAISGYVQGRYTADLGDGLSVQPKAKLGYTYVDQDDAKDAYFGVSDAKVSTFDVEVGADLVKTVALEKGKMNLLAGVSYTRAMRDTDSKFDGRFYGAKVSDRFDVLGAEIAENTVKFNVGAEVEHDNGLFYNGGMTYEFGSDDTKAYGVNVGAGYRF